MASQANSTKYTNKNLSNPSQAHPKDRRGGNTSTNVLQGHHDSDIKTNKAPPKKKIRVQYLWWI